METIALADYLSTLPYKDIHAKTYQDVKNLFIDYVGVGLAGSTTESGRIGGQFALQESSRDDATLFTGGMSSAGMAAFANAISAHSIELDDVDDMALFHYSPPIVSAALALAEKKGSIKHFLKAVAGGCETMVRISKAVNPSLRNRGFHTTAVCGVFGAVAAAGIILELDSKKMASALGLAGAQASGLMEMYGPSMQKRFNPGPTARNGVYAALMSSLGFTGADTILEGERGFVRACSDKYSLDELTKNLGEEYDLGIEYKIYAAARPIHNAVDSALAIREMLVNDSISLSDITHIEIARHPLWVKYHLNPNPRNYHEAQVSLPYSVSIAFLEGDAFLEQYTSPKEDMEEIKRLINMISIKEDKSLPRGVSCHLTVNAGGKVYSHQTDYPSGSIQNPLTEEKRQDKFMKLLSLKGMDEEVKEELYQKLNELEKLKDLSGITSYFK